MKNTRTKAREVIETMKRGDREKLLPYIEEELKAARNMSREAAQYIYELEVMKKKIEEEVA